MSNGGAARAAVPLRHAPRPRHATRRLRRFPSRHLRPRARPIAHPAHGRVLAPARTPREDARGLIRGRRRRLGELLSPRPSGTTQRTAARPAPRASLRALARGASVRRSPRSSDRPAATRQTQRSAAARELARIGTRSTRAGRHADGSGGVRAGELARGDSDSPSRRLRPRIGPARVFARGVRAGASTRPCTWMCNRASPAGEGAGSGNGEAGELRAAVDLPGANAAGACDALKHRSGVT